MFNPFQAGVPILYPIENIKTVLRGFRKGTLTWNGLRLAEWGFANNKGRHSTYCHLLATSKVCSTIININAKVFVKGLSINEIADVCGKFLWDYLHNAFYSAICTWFNLFLLTAEATWTVYSTCRNKCFPITNLLFAVFVYVLVIN